MVGGRLVVLGRQTVLEDRGIDLPRPRNAYSEAFGRQLLDVRGILARAFDEVTPL